MVQITPFDLLHGQDVPLITLSDGTVSVELLPYGATIRAIRVPDRAGNAVDVCLGYETLAEYRQQDAYLGAIIGRCANRIGGARFAIDGREYRLTANEGENQLHGGPAGFHQKLWAYTCDESSVTFSADSPDGEEGFPGNLHAEVTYTLKDGTLTIDYQATTDADTVVNLTNHAYFNLGGQVGGTVTDHVLTLQASHYTPAGAGNIPTGEILPVDGTPLDLRSGAVLGERLNDPFLRDTRGYDHNFALDGGEAAAAELYCPRTGIALELRTTLEGVQIYTAGFLTERCGKAGAVYGPAHAVCLETQHFPDAANHANFPSPILRAGQKYHETTSYRFFTR